ncbi:MAG: Phosphoglycolate phosphatase, chromosomal [Rhodocyclaceae bacterium]|nr:phosphoglycolate phosphatase [Zoogloeaceae bacterium]MBV6408944.1 Phosphoglycolate phosphatase, chromosomal [Rhodocyclaceae bacterium]
MPIKAVLIDLDGTLLDTVPDLADAANAMLAGLGRLTLPIDTIRDFVGKGIPNLVGRCLGHPGESDAAEVREALAVFKRHYAAVNGRKTRIYPGVLEGLRAMREAGLKTACVTNKAAAFTGPLLAATGLAALLDLTVSGDTLAEKKPHPLPFLHICERFGVAPAEALVVGDSRNDVAGARAAGCPVFCVPYGYSEGEDVRDLGADAIVATLEEAAGLITAK